MPPCDMLLSLASSPAPLRAFLACEQLAEARQVIVADVLGSVARVQCNSSLIASNSVQAFVAPLSVTSPSSFFRCLL